MTTRSDDATAAVDPVTNGTAMKVTDATAASPRATSDLLVARSVTDAARAWTKNAALAF